MKQKAWEGLRSGDWHITGTSLLSSTTSLVVPQVQAGHRNHTIQPATKGWVWEKRELGSQNSLLWNFTKRAKEIISRKGAGETVWNPDLLNIRFSPPSSFTAQRSFDGGDTEQSCHEHWSPAKPSAGCHPLRGLSYSWLQLAEPCGTIPIL